MFGLLTNDSPLILLYNQKIWSLSFYAPPKEREVFAASKRRRGIFCDDVYTLVMDNIHPLVVCIYRSRQIFFSKKKKKKKKEEEEKS